MTPSCSAARPRPTSPRPTRSKSAADAAANIFNKAANAPLSATAGDETGDETGNDGPPPLPTD